MLTLDLNVTADTVLLATVAVNAAVAACRAFVTYRLSRIARTAHPQDVNEALKTVNEIISKTFGSER
jgi:hypothetical protein